MAPTWDTFRHSRHQRRPILWHDERQAAQRSLIGRTYDEIYIGHTTLRYVEEAFRIVKSGLKRCPVGIAVNEEEDTARFAAIVFLTEHYVHIVWLVIDDPSVSGI